MKEEQKETETVFKQSGERFYLEKKGEVHTNLPAGVYNVNMTMDGMMYFDRIIPVTDKLLTIKGSVSEEIVEDIRKFSTPETRKRFKTYNVVHKRGYLLHGPGGSGKTASAIKAAHVLTEAGAVILFNPNPALLGSAVSMIRQNDPVALIGVIYEEFDDYLQGSSSTLLSVLDGELQVDNFVVIACTNYLSRIPARIKSRPSRFARVIEVGVPSREFREEFFRQKLAPEDQDQLVAFVDASDGFVVDQMKDLVVSVFCMGETLANATLKIKDMQADSVGMDDYRESAAEEVFAELRSSKGPKGFKPKLL